MGAHAGLDKSDVLEAAAAIVDEVGIEKLALARVAEKLGVRSQSLYAHVGGLSGLRRDLTVYVTKLEAARWRRAIMAKSGRDALMALMEELVRSGQEHPGLAQLVSWSKYDPTDQAMFDALQEGWEPFAILLGTYGLTGDDVVHWYRIIWTSLQGFLALQSGGMMMLPADPEVSLRLLMEHLADGLERVRTTGDTITVHD
jgi:AcrR family transcriptional regulator